MLPASRKSATADNKPSPAAGRQSGGEKRLAPQSDRLRLPGSAQADACFGPLFWSDPTNHHVNPVNPVR